MKLPRECPERHRKAKFLTLEKIFVLLAATICAFIVKNALAVAWSMPHRAKISQEIFYHKASAFFFF
jgi:hypothetical protein